MADEGRGADASDARLPLELDDLRLVVVVAEELHFGRAALRLHLSQPGLSYRVRRLEEALGYQVFTRTRRAVAPTPAGEALIDGARRLLGETHRLVDDGRRVARGELASLRVGFVGTALYSMLPAVLRETRRRHPELRVVVEECKTAVQVQGLRSGRLDIGLVHLPLDADTGLETVPVLKDRVGLALPADHPLARRPQLALADVADEPFVLFPRELEPQTHDRYVDACVEAGFAPRTAHRATGLPTILGLVAAGMGVAFVAGSVAANTTRTGVAFRPLAGPAPQLVTGPAWRPHDVPAAVELLRQVVLDVGDTHPSY
jgi:DNA-binding transcriptional LysR family regulator